MREISEEGVRGIVSIGWRVCSEYVWVHRVAGKSPLG